MMKMTERETELKLYEWVAGLLLDDGIIEKIIRKKSERVGKSESRIVNVTKDIYGINTHKTGELKGTCYVNGIHLRVIVNEIGVLVNYVGHEARRLFYSALLRNSEEHTGG